MRTARVLNRCSQPGARRRPPPAPCGRALGGSGSPSWFVDRYPDAAIVIGDDAIGRTVYGKGRNDGFGGWVEPGQVTIAADRDPYFSFRDYDPKRSIAYVDRRLRSI